ncbi:serine hydrolase domain-containing protein [Fodinicola acaciae]|uniref:serine hydrolase domain-containing protein n=1 Tax=Fodinicola acaciae TaxID=2681555 RepID=UPI0013D8DBB5|nr:serine hydrolase domain-containing protein [Fodinicola acaciae]
MGTALRSAAAQLITNLTATSAIPAVCVTAFDREGEIFTFCHGPRDIDCPRTPLDPYTRFRTYSLTKMFTATVILRLVDDGRIRLDQPISSFLPSGAPDALRAATVRQLLGHMSGLVRDTGATAIGRDLADYVTMAAIHTPSIAPPGIIYAYSDAGFALLGHLVEQVTGTEFSRAVNEWLFEPLGMRSSCFDNGGDPASVSAEHAMSRDGVMMSIAPRKPAPGERPANGAFSSCHDIARFGMAHLRGRLPLKSSQRLVSAGLLSDMSNRGADIGLDVDFHYGLGAYVGPRFGEDLGYGNLGHGLGCWSRLVLLPRSGLGLAWFDNLAGSLELNWRREETIQQILAVAGAERPSWECLPDPTRVPPEQAVGSYRRLTGRPLLVQLRDDRLRIGNDAVTVPLRWHHGSTYVAAADADRAAASLVPTWTPSALTSPCTVRFVPSETATVNYLSVNGVPFRRNL